MATKTPPKKTAPPTKTPAKKKEQKPPPSESGGGDAITKITDPLTPENMAKTKAWIDSVMASGNEYGSGLASKYFAPGSMGRVDEHISPEQQAALNDLHTQYQNSLVRSPEAQAILNQWNDSAKGLDSASNQALRESMQQAGDENYLNQVATIGQSNAKYGVTGAAATARLDNASTALADNRRDQERDLLVANVQQKQQALQGLTNYNTTLEQNEATNRSKDLNDYYSGVENKDAEELSRKSYNQANASSENAGAAAAQLGGAGIYAGLAGNANAQETGAQNLQSIIDLTKRQQDLAAKYNSQYISAIGGK